MLNTYNLVGTISLIEERENKNGKYRLLQVRPLECNRAITFFISPEYKSGNKNPVYDTLNTLLEGNKVKLTFSLVGSSFFLFNAKKVG